MSRIVYTSSEKRRNYAPVGRPFLLVGIGLMVLLLFSAVIYILRLPNFLINNIEVSGGSDIESKIVAEKVEDNLSGFYFSLIPKKNYFFVRTGEISEAIKKDLPRLEEVSAETAPFKTLKIRIKERRLWGIQCDYQYLDFAPSRGADKTAPGGDAIYPKPACFYIDESGIAYEEAPETSGVLIKTVKTDFGGIALGESSLPAGAISEFSEIEKQADLHGLGPVIIYIIVSWIPDAIQAKTAGGMLLILNVKDDYSRVFSVLKTVLENEIKDKAKDIDYIDLRFGNKVFYKYK